jgi:hypothetical protein
MEPLYKYISAITATKILQNKTLRFSSPKKLFNDPFDCRINFINDINKEELVEKAFEVIKDHLKNNSLNQNSPLYNDIIKHREDIINGGLMANKIKIFLLKMLESYDKVTMN